ncbi:LuxR family transcriptional regulator [Spongiactinospora rosea]|uniref:LuxR family transcriptional regulator n=1 Tax=Spongiactinospora rosea TaxID=2248750 RepID=UPI0011C06E03|nr:LuxR family transcriptional regulator [Spongiactinospora rosea]
MNGPGFRVVLVPDLGEDLARAAAMLERAMLSLRAAERRGTELPGPLAAGAALGALRRLWRAVAPTQGGSAAGRLYGAGGRVEHLPLRLVDIDPVDVVTLSAAAAVLGAGHAPVGAALPPDGPPAGDLAAAAARFSGLLDLADTAESIVLRERLAAAGPGADVTLTPAQEAAYRHTADRLHTMWPRP